MRAFYDLTGHVKLWLHPSGTWLLDVHGHPLAFVHGDSVYDFKGHHVGWWDGATIQNHEGRLLVMDREAPHLGATSPPYHPRPIPPTVEASTPPRPTLGLRPSRPARARWEWGDVRAFLLGLAAVQPLYL
jgi:hypothetical protein